MNRTGISTEIVPKHATIESAGADVVSTERVVIPAGELVLISTGTYMPTVPVGYFMMLTPRSSICFKKGLIQPNSVGIIDADYPDEIKLPLYNISGADVVIEANERIGQLVCMKYAQVFPVQQNKRSGGFGSTNEKGE